MFPVSFNVLKKAKSYVLVYFLVLGSINSVGMIYSQRMKVWKWQITVDGNGYAYF